MSGNADQQGRTSFIFRANERTIIHESGNPVSYEYEFIQEYELKMIHLIHFRDLVERCQKTLPSL